MAKTLKSRMLWIAIPLCIASSLVDAALLAEEGPASLECRWADGEMAIDGKADEAAWAKAQVIERFSLPWLGKAERQAKTATRARLLWDRENLYFFATMVDSDLYADANLPDAVLWENDVFELFFKPADEAPGYYEFQVNAAGAVLDMHRIQAEQEALYAQAA